MPNDSRSKDVPTVLEERKHKIISTFLVSLGLDGDDLINLWTEGLDKDSDAVSSASVLNKEPLERNLKKVYELESKAPGICLTLSNQFGIKFFDRYSTDLLLQQYQNRDNKDLPYGVIIYPYGDPNMAFYFENEVFDQFRAQLEGRYLIRVAEVNNPRALVSRINNFRHNYGMISFGILGGHGQPDSIQFGNTHGDVLHLSDLKRKGAGAISLAFHPDAPIVFNSCSTGAKGGIGQGVSRLLDTKTTAPNKPINAYEPKSIEAQIDQNGKLQLHLNYNKGNLGVDYQGGEKSQLPS